MSVESFAIFLLIELAHTLLLEESLPESLGMLLILAVFVTVAKMLGKSVCCKLSWPSFVAGSLVSL